MVLSVDDLLLHLPPVDHVLPRETVLPCVINRPRMLPFTMPVFIAVAIVCGERYSQGRVGDAVLPRHEITSPHAST